MNLHAVASGVILADLTSKATSNSKLSQADKEFWKKLQLYALILVSLSLQFVLLRIGYARRSSRKGSLWRSYLVRPIYLLADWAATVSLATLLKREQLKVNEMEVFWAPFLVLHLGSTENLAAYFTEDSDLWFKYLVGLVIQFGMAIYLFWKFHAGSGSMTYIAILVFIAGFVKCGERIWFLRSSTFKQLKDSMLLAKQSKLLATATDQDMITKGSKERLEEYLERKQIDPKFRYLHQAELLFKVFMPVFADLRLRVYNKLSYVFCLHRSQGAEEAFKIVDTELEFLHSAFYSKTIILNPSLGFALRSICLFSSLSALIAFSVAVNHLIDLHSDNASSIDIGITYALLFGAIFADIYALVAHVFSNSTIVWLTASKNRVARFLYATVVSRFGHKAKRGIESVAQLSLLDYCINSRWKTKFRNIFDKQDILGKYWHTTWRHVDSDLKEAIFSHLLFVLEGYRETGFDYKYLRERLSARGYDAASKYAQAPDLTSSLTDMEFTHSILVWHIATDIVYHADRLARRAGALGPYCQISKQLSGYLMYLLCMRASMLPESTTKLRLRDTCLEARQFFPEGLEFDQAVLVMCGIDTETRSFFVEMGSERKSSFFEGCQLAGHLQSLVSVFQWDHEEKWEMIGKIWLEMLTYAASKCEWKEHVKHLKQGEESLTHVALLMAHFGLSKKIKFVPLPLRLEEVGFEPVWYWGNLDRLAYYLA
ncbi:uncharacterized protein LOC111274178 [Durio zibethinus]|uniref:Uncharacterized protein LOC111274178 n=1 Tax=Durio zibethinus TaxID=66656 RepID=A0A6P5WFA3_DURZI|nr:uncharacterized protein LOC111274178 [Durio zibethinus]